MSFLMIKVVKIEIDAVEVGYEIKIIQIYRGIIYSPLRQKNMLDDSGFFCLFVCSPPPPPPPPPLF